MKMIGRRRRSLRAKMQLARKGNSIQTISREDCLAASCYLYTVCSYFEEIHEFSSEDEIVDVFLKIVSKLNLWKKLDSVLKKIIDDLEENGVLTKIDENSEIPIPSFRRTQIRYKYNEDANIDDFMPRGVNLSKYSVIIDIFRYLMISDDPARLPKLVSKTLLLGKTFGTFPEKIMKILDDVSPLDFIIDAVKLSKNEARVLKILYHTSSIIEIAEIMQYTNSENRDDFCEKILGIEPLEISTIFRSDQKLRSFGFINEESEITDEAINCIKTGNMDAFFSEILHEIDVKDAFPLDSYATEKANVDLAKRLLQSGNSNILLYGAPGSGKTEFAKSIAKECGLRAFVFQNNTEMDGQTNVLCRLNCLLSINKSDSIIIIDEADSILQTAGSGFSFLFGGMSQSSEKKGTVNKIFENSNNRVIWIANHTSQIEESTKRRFNYSIVFSEMPEKTLRKIADERLKTAKNLGIETRKKILDLCSSFRVTGSSVENVLRVINCSQNESETALLSDVRNVLEANSSLLYGKAKMRDFLSESYDESVLNTNFSAQKIITMVQNAAKYSEREKSAKNGIRLLFYGESGTGKTEFARFLAQKLGKKILLKRASDILGMYVGENERHIKEAFEEADSSGQILLFDEADSFFASRETASKSYERTLVNEFLTQMEEFSGILICTTNLKQIMDAAMNRRFHICVEFRALGESGIKTLLLRYFPNLDFSQSGIERLLQKSTVTPGDFGTLSGRIRFMDESDINADFVIEELLKLQDEKNGAKSIGFGK